MGPLWFFLNQWNFSAIVSSVALDDLRQSHAHRLVWLRAVQRIPAMSKMDFSITVEIPTPPPLVWSVIADVERWPEWTASISRLRLLSPGPLRIGSRVRIHQPKLPAALWQVTELDPGAGFTWVSRAPGARVTARHIAKAVAIGTEVTLSITYEGWIGALLARWIGDLNERYLAMEAAGLKAHCTKTSERDLALIR